MWWFAGTAMVVLLGGCNLVFPISAGDGSAVDAALPGELDAALPADDDEDRDGVSNRKDLCPGVPDPEQLDDDGDKIGDACDPRPRTAGDEVVFVALFNANEDARVCTTPPEWTQRDGFIEVASPTLTELDCGAAGVDPARLTIETGWEILADSGAVARVGGAIGSDGGFLEAQGEALSIGVDDVADALPPEVGELPARPARLVVQLELTRGDPVGTRLEARVVPDTTCEEPSDCDRSASSELTPNDHVRAFARGAHARLLHMVLYRR